MTPCCASHQPLKEPEAEKCGCAVSDLTLNKLIFKATGTADDSRRPEARDVDIA